ncbi:MAG: RNA polymerase sigma factor [Bacteroidota bacterium]
MKAANSAAFKVIYQAYADKMYYLCLRYLKEEADARDALQESFIQAYQKIESFQGKGSFEGWLRRIVVNKCLNMIRINSRKEAWFDQQSTVEDQAVEVRLDQVEAGRLSQILFEAVSQLPDGYRAIVNLVLIEGYAHKEVSEMLGISESTSRSQLVRARTHLKQILIKLGVEEIAEHYYE